MLNGSSWWEIVLVIGLFVDVGGHAAELVKKL
jgi:hypothetical protein